MQVFLPCLQGLVSVQVCECTKDASVLVLICQGRACKCAKRVEVTSTVGLMTSFFSVLKHVCVHIFLYIRI